MDSEGELLDKSLIGVIRRDEFHCMPKLHQPDASLSHTLQGPSSDGVSRCNNMQ